VVACPADDHRVIDGVSTRCFDGAGDKINVAIGIDLGDLRPTRILNEERLRPARIGQADNEVRGGEAVHREVVEVAALEGVDELRDMGVDDLVAGCGGGESRH
jgi:hypothetical protein